MWSRARSSASGPRQAPVWVNPCSRTTGGPEPIDRTAKDAAFGRGTGLTVGWPAAMTTPAPTPDDDVQRTAGDRTAGDTAAAYCATLIDEWVRLGLTDAVVAPGSRSTPMALALADAARVRVHVVHDERSAAFMALGLGLAAGRPAVLLCTSGTAAANFHPAVVEAHQAAVPMVVITADRPPELQGVGAPQTIDQRQLYGTAVRWFCEPGPPDDGGAPWWRDMARDALDADARHHAGTRAPEPGLPRAAGGHAPSRRSRRPTTGAPRPRPCRHRRRLGSGGRGARPPGRRRLRASGRDRRRCPGCRVRATTSPRC